MSSFSNPSRPDVDPDEPGESFESVPWESLRFEGSNPNGRRWYLVAGAVALAAIVISAWTRLTPEPPTPLVVASPTTTLPAPTTTGATVPELLTEADLKAVDPVRIERRVMAFAEAAVAEYFSADAGGIWSGVEFETVRSTYTERASAVSATALGAGTYRVLVAASVLDAGDDGMFERRPLRGVTVDIDASSETLTVLGLPSPASLAFGGLERADGVEEAPAGVLSEAVARWQPAFGQLRPESATVVTDRAGTRRVQVEIVDAAGNRWPVSIPMAPDGSLERFDAQP